MKRLLLFGLVVAAVGLGVAGGSAASSTLCVGGPHCFSTIQAALNAAHDGDTIQIGPGTFAGGVTITKSINLVGAGATLTVIKGGGPVLTVGTFGAETEPTVSIDGMTITGGSTTSSAESVAFDGAPGVLALGGGIEVPPNADTSGGANVTISDTIVAGNRAAPTATVPSPSGAQCPGNTICPFARGAGGGIDTWGDLTLRNSVVSGNQVGGPVASSAEGGGISSHVGLLTVTNSVITGNQATASAPNGRNPNGGGINIDSGSFDMTSSSVVDNSTTLAAGLPSFVQMEAGGGGIFVSENATAASISNTMILRNSATMTNSVGDATAFSGGLHTNITIALSNDTLAGNHVNATTLPGSTGNADGSSGAGEINGTFRNIQLIGNTVTVRSAAGIASAEGGASIWDGGSITNGVIDGNHVDVSSPSGSVSVSGGGIFAAVDLSLSGSTVRGNTVVATGPSGTVFGGGIYDVAFPFGPDGPPGGPLVLQNSALTNNVLAASAGVTRQGGGLYTQGEPLTLTGSVIARNVPDQCFGC